MTKYAYIFPDGSYFACNLPNAKNHIDTVKAFMKGLEITNPNTYKKLSRIFKEHYANENFDDFAVFSLGWIKITTQDKSTLCFAGYNFQYPIIQNYLTPNYVLEEIHNFYNFPVVSNLKVDYVKLILIGLASIT